MEVAVNAVLSPRELALAIGVSESSLKRWADDGRIRVSRTAGGHRRISMDEAVRFIRETGSPLVRPEILGFPDIARFRTLSTTGASPAQRLYDLLLHGKGPEARGMILSAYLGGESMAAVIDGPIREAMARIGALWRESEDGIFIEHRASEICMSALLQVQVMLLSPGDDAPIAVGGGPSLDTAILPSLCASIVLTSEGYRSINLGAQTPLDTLAYAAEHHRARLAWLAITHPCEMREAQAEIERVARYLQSIGTRLIIGGSNHVDSIPAGATNIFTGGSMSELAAFARGLIAAGERRSETTETNEAHSAQRPA